jgi:hypothetical protein
MINLVPARLAEVILSLSKEDIYDLCARNRLKSPFDKLRMISS